MKPLKLTDFVKRKVVALRHLLYRTIYLPYRAHQIRKKDSIRVAFLVSNIGWWKTELLYVEMLRHNRFTPLLILTHSSGTENFNKLKKHCELNNYKYYEREDAEGSLWKEYHPDIIFYEQPYRAEFVDNLKSLFCYISYGFNITTEDWGFKTDLIYNAWQVYYENENLCRWYNSHLGKGVHNGHSTGHTAMDELMVPKEKLENTWKNQSDSKKRIIYAPHHSIDPKNWWQSSTFLETGIMMLKIAEQYSNKVQWAFKPHPILRNKLESIWGKEKTDEYYAKWADVEWSQYENGKYINLFKYSDALIHDCASFIEEYFVTGNPVMYLTNKDRTDSKWNDTVSKAYQLHYKGYSKESIETFIQNVIQGIDSLKEDRATFFNEHLTPPYGNTACQNIINCILYHDMSKKMNIR